MPSEQSSRHMPDDTVETNSTISSGIQPISLLPFAVQPQDIYPIEIVAKRFPVAISVLPLQMLGEFNLIELAINPENLQAQIILEGKITSAEEPRIFEIFFKIVGMFTYSSEYTPEMAGQFLQQGGLSILLPFARELVLSLSTRLHLPPIVLSLVQLTSPSKTLDE